MAAAPILALRQAIITHLRADVGVTGTAVGARIYGERAPTPPTWPFARYGMSDAVPGFDVTAPIHVYSKDAFTDDVNAIAEAIGNSLDDKVLTLDGGQKAHLTWDGVRVVGSAPDEWHAIVNIGARIPRDCG